MTLTPRRLLTAFIAATAALLITPALASAKTAAVFDNPNYVDTTNNTGAESDNIQASIAAKGYAVRPFTGLSGHSFSAALAGAKVLVIPEQEIAELAPDLPDEAAFTIRRYVASGGGLIITNNTSTNAASFLDRVFDIAVTEGSNPGTTTKRAAAAGTAFSAGPASLPANDGTNFFTGLPNGAASIYRNGVNSSVVVFAFGAGEIVFLGWDWFDSNPPDTGPTGQNGGWQKILRLALNEVAGTGCNVSGTTGADTLKGTARGDRICARGGGDKIYARGGKDYVIAGKGGDTVKGGGGNDKLIGGAGPDTLNGNGGKDLLDTRDGVHGNDHAKGGPGKDTCRRDIGDHVSSC